VILAIFNIIGTAGAISPKVAEGASLFRPTGFYGSRLKAEILRESRGCRPAAA